MVRLEDEIKQVKFPSETSKAAVNVLYTAAWLNTGQNHVLKPFRISWQQFNIMRILRGQKGRPAPLKLISERMIDKMSNTSRLVDKLVEKGLADRQTCAKDRRQVDILLTQYGYDVLEQASEAMENSINTRFAHLDEQELEALNILLDKLRTID